MTWSSTSTGSLPRGARMESDGRRLVFDRVTVADQGEYICTAVNNRGRADARVIVYVSQGTFLFTLTVLALTKMMSLQDLVPPTSPSRLPSAPWWR